MITIKEPTKDRLNLALSLRGMKKIELAERCGINPGFITQYCNGTREPKSDKIYMIAQALDVDPVWLCGFDVPMEKQIAPSSSEQTAEDAALMNMISKLDKEHKERLKVVVSAYLLEMGK